MHGYVRYIFQFGVRVFCLVSIPWIDPLCHRLHLFLGSGRYRFRFCHRLRRNSSGLFGNGLFSVRFRLLCGGWLCDRRGRRNNCLLYWLWCSGLLHRRRHVVCTLLLMLGGFLLICGDQF